MFDGRRIDGWAARSHRAAGRRLRARGPRPLQGADGRGEPAPRAVGTPGRRRRRTDLEFVHDDVSDPPRAGATAGRDALGRRAADAGSRPRDAPAAAPADARRALAGAGAPRRPVGLRGARHHQPARAPRSCSSSRTPAWLSASRAGARSSRPGASSWRGPRPSSGERRRARGSTSGSAGRRRVDEGLAALPQEEAMVMTTTEPRSLPELFTHQVAPPRRRARPPLQGVRHLAPHLVARYAEEVRQGRGGAPGLRAPPRRERGGPGRQPPGVALLSPRHHDGRRRDRAASIRPPRPTRCATCSTTPRPG